MTNPDDLNEENDQTPTPPQPGEPDGDETPMGENQICVDLSALSMPDEQDQMQPPAVGDLVQANIEGKVDSIQGDKAYVTMTAVNGQPVEDEDEGPSDNDEQEMANLQGMAEQMPERY